MCANTGYEPTISKYFGFKVRIFTTSGGHISSLPRWETTVWKSILHPAGEYARRDMQGEIPRPPREARYVTMIRRSRHRDANQGSFKHQVRYRISKPSQGVTAAILAWPPHEAAAAFGTRPGRAGTVPDRLEGSDGTPFRSRAWP